MTQIELDKGILERLMSSDISNETDIHKDNTTTKPAQTKRNKSKKSTGGSGINADCQNETDLGDVSMPIVQVINIQNIATSAFLLKYNKNIDNKNRKSDTDSYEDVENEEDDDEHEATKSSDRFLLILSDGEFYETRCLLLPNLNYLVSKH